jgi:hypothetical protein
VNTALQTTKKKSVAIFGGLFVVFETAKKKQRKIELTFLFPSTLSCRVDAAVYQIWLDESGAAF